MSSAQLNAAGPAPALAALSVALDPESVLPLLARAAGSSGATARNADVRTAVLSHKAGRRCVIRYEWIEPGAAQGASSRSLVGKLYADERRAARAYERMIQLRGQPWQAAEPSVPAPLLFVPELGLILQECVQGADLRRAVAGTHESPFALAARWLGRLHRAPPVAGLKERSLDHELSRIDAWQAEIAPQLPADPASRLHDARERWRNFARDLAPPERVMIHKDYYLAHVLWDGRGVWVVDFDELAVGDPAFDVAHFLAHLEYHAQRSNAEPAPWSEAAACFRGAYPAAQAGRSFDARLRFYAAYTFLKLAATVLRRRREGWERLAGSLAASACREAEGLPCVGGEGP